MGPKERIFKKSYANELLSIAANDLQAARALLIDPLVRRETVLLMLQQCIEKSLKSVLCSLGKPLPLSHELYLLVERLGTENTPPYANELDDLTPYASIRRYEEGTFELTEQDIKLAIKMTEQVAQWCKNKVDQNV